MRVRRLTVALLVHLLVCLALAPSSFGNKNADIPKFEPPVQNYAVIDISGTAATSPVDQIALNDDNRASFGFGTGTGPLPDVYHTYTWQNGVLGAEQKTNLVIDNGSYPIDGLDPAFWPYEELYGYVSGLLSDGTIYGEQYAYLFRLDGVAWFEDGAELNQHMFRSTGGDQQTFDLPSPFYWSDNADAEHANSGGPLFGLVSEKGAITGSSRYMAFQTDGGQDSVIYFMNYLCKADGTWFMFPPTTSTASVTVPPSISMQSIDFGPTIAVNNNGWFTAQKNTSQGSILWKGDTNVADFGLDYAWDLNDQGQVVAIVYTASGDFATSGYLWENNTRTMFTDELPIWMSGQYYTVQPLSISNQAKASSTEPPALLDPTTDTTIHILTSTTGIDVGTYGETVWTRDNSGKWTFANIALPDGTTIDDFTSINSSGVIAAIGNGGHALLLVPVYVTADTDNNYQVDLESTTDDSSSTSAFHSDSDPDPQVKSSTDQVLPYVRFGLWDNAFDGSGNIRNDNAEANNFVGSDSRRFYFSILAKIASMGISLHWNTDSDSGGGNDTITLTQSTKDPTLFATKALMLVSDDVDKIPVNTGLQGGGNASAGNPDYRLRKAALGDKVHFKLTSNATGNTLAMVDKPIFDPNPDRPDSVKMLKVQVVNTRNGTPSAPGIEDASRQSNIQNAILVTKQRLAVAGIEANIQYNANVDTLYIPKDGSTGVDLYDFHYDENFDSVSPFLTDDELNVINPLRAKYGSSTDTCYLIVIGQFTRNTLNGESIPVGSLYAHPKYTPGLNCSFIKSAASQTTAAHELGHLLLNRFPADMIGIFDQVLGKSTVGHYVGYQEGYNLMYGSGSNRHGAFTDAKRLWNDQDHYDGVHSGSASSPKAPFQIDYMRHSNLLH